MMCCNRFGWVQLKYRYTDRVSCGGLQHIDNLPCFVYINLWTKVLLLFTKFWPQQVQFINSIKFSFILNMKAQYYSALFNIEINWRLWTFVWSSIDIYKDIPLFRNLTVDHFNLVSNLNFFVWLSCFWCQKIADSILQFAACVSLKGYSI